MHTRALAIAAAVSIGLVAPMTAANFHGAIYTSLSDGTEVNFNIYSAKEDVYLNGGPGKGAGSSAQGLPDGIYVFMVTDPSGQDLLSTDPAECRQVEVVGGVIDGAVGPACRHVEGSAAVGTPVQLMPYDDTPNNGGEYKVWLTPLDAYQCDLEIPAESCDRGHHFGFVHSSSKTDNFKVGDEVADEIDTRFWDGYLGGPILDGRRIRWIDTHGASNVKWSYYAPEVLVNHEAHVEAPEIGTHYIEIPNQEGCTVGEVYLAGTKRKKAGPQTVPVRVTRNMKRGTFTIFVDVVCR